MQCPYCGSELEKSILKRVICMKCFRWVDTESLPMKKPEQTIPHPTEATFGIEYQIEDQTAVVSGYHGTESHVVIAAKYGPYRVTRIKAGAFLGNRQVKELEIPDSVTTIEKDAFSNCIYLESVSLGACVNRIEEGAFYHCVSLRTVDYKELPQHVAVSAFGGCYNMPTGIKNRLCMGD